jgi:hypothetical protein
VKVNEQVELDPTAGTTSVQLRGLPDGDGETLGSVNVPVVGLELNATVPEGAAAGTAAVSVTVAVQVVGCPGPDGGGEQMTPSEVASADAVAGAAAAAPAPRTSAQQNEMIRRPAMTYSGITSWKSRRTSRDGSGSR